MTEYLIIFLEILIFLTVILAAGWFFLMERKLKYKIAKVEINGKIFEAEFVDTILKKTKGLSGRKTLEEDRGMLFIFAKPSKHIFWMAGMNFPLDIIWIRNNKIIDISKNIASPKKWKLPAIVSPLTKADRVLEISAGSAEKFNIKTGDEAIIS